MFKVWLSFSPFFTWKWYFSSKIRFVSSIGIEDVRNTRHWFPDIAWVHPWNSVGVLLPVLWSYYGLSNVTAQLFSTTTIIKKKFWGNIHIWSTNAAGWHTLNLKGTVHPKLKIDWNCMHSRVIQDVDNFVSSSDLEKCSISSLAQQRILCSEWVPSEWESKQLIKTSH